MLYLNKFINEHKNWEELLTHKPYGLHIARDNGYILFKYDMIESDFHLPEVLEARGIVFRENDFKCVCHPFNKFGNYGESYCPEINWESASVQEKIDGSLIKFWYDNNSWHISTNGTIDAFKANLDSSIKFKSFGDLVLFAMPVAFEKFTEKMNKAHTYMFELISPFNRVVIEYKEPKLYFLGERDLETGNEIFPEDSVYLKSIDFKLDYPKRFNLHSLDDVKAAAEVLPWNEEGYVVCDKDFNRVKIKSPSYVKAHYARNNNAITYERIMDIILCGEEDEFLIYASDFKEELEMIKAIYNSMLKEIHDTIKELNKPGAYADRKSYAQVVLTKPRWIQAFLFNFNKIDKYLKKIQAWKWIELMKSRGDLHD